VLLRLLNQEGFFRTQVKTKVIHVFAGKKHDKKSAKRSSKNCRNLYLSQLCGPSRPIAGIYNQHQLKTEAEIAPAGTFSDCLMMLSVVKP
jgi:hypothetical protein